MKRGLKSVIGAMLIPFAAMNMPARSTWEASWEFSYQDKKFATENQVELRGENAFIGGSVRAHEGRGEYGLAMKAGPASLGKGNFKGKPQKSYFNGTDKSRDHDFYAGFRMRNTGNISESEVFGGAKIKNIYLNTSQMANDRSEHKIYTDLGGRVMGLSNEKQGDAKTTGAYYMKGDFGGQVNFLPNNPGSRLILRNLLAKTGDHILDDSERLDAEIGYGKATGRTATMGYNMERKDGVLRRFYFALGYAQDGSEGTVIENNITLKFKNPLNLRWIYKPEANEANVGLDLKY